MVRLLIGTVDLIDCCTNILVSLIVHLGNLIHDFEYVVQSGSGSPFEAGKICSAQKVVVVRQPVLETKSQAEFLYLFLAD